MRTIKMIGLAVFAVLAFGVVAASAASAHEFESSETGPLMAEQLGTQTFVTKAGTVECETLSAEGTATAGKTATQAAVVQYENCTAFGLEATISPAHYTFEANGKVEITAPITITAPLCEVTVPAGQKLEGVTYTQDGKGIALSAVVGGITSSGKGLGCSYSSESAGKYEGESLVLLVNASGTLTYL